MADKKPRCAKCGRVLTSAASIARGIGPECAGLSGGKGPAKPGRPRKGRRGTYDAGASGGSGVDALVVHAESVARNGEDAPNGAETEAN